MKVCRFIVSLCRRQNCFDFYSSVFLIVDEGYFSLIKSCTTVVAYEILLN